jgi:phosphoribosylamine-glycine ligase
VTINVVLTSKGYPETFQKGSRIMISGKPLVFMAGATNKNEEIVTNGGRVLSVVATDTNIDKARVKVYREIANVRFDDSYYRKDIGSN